MARRRIRARRRRVREAGYFRELVTWTYARLTELRKTHVLAGGMR